MKNISTMLSTTEENYIKAIYKLSESSNKTVSTNALASHINTTAAAVTDMLKRLAEKEIIHYVKYKGVTLTMKGTPIAIALIRRHRLWEYFLVDKLRFGWENVHELAEQFEHIHSDELIARLDAFLNYPKFDPHGDPIPNAEGKFTLRTQLPLSEMSSQYSAVVIAVKEHSKAFLKYLNQIKIKLGSQIQILERIDFDGSIKILINNKETHTISNSIAQLIYVKRA